MMCSINYLEDLEQVTQSSVLTICSAPVRDGGGRGWPRGRGGFGGGGRVGGWPRGGGGFGERGRGRGAVGRGRGRGGRSGQPVSANDLDADLDKYHSQATQTS